MAKINWEQLREIVKNTSKDVLKKAVMVDGHTIYTPEKFLEAGLDASIINVFTKKLRSGNHPKETLYVDGQQVQSLTGVYGLELLEFIASCFEIDSWKMGRGSRAAHLAEQLTEKWAA